MIRYAIYTLGCKVNQYETQAMETLLQQRGARPCADEAADVVIINTCAVTAEAGRKSRQAVRRLAEAHPGALVAVCGCFSQIEPDMVKEMGADIVFGSADRAKLVDAVLERLPAESVDDPFKRRWMEILPAGAVSGRTRAMMKIQDGCDNFCTYCVIPYSRGRVRSLPMEEARKQAAGLCEDGFKEIVVTGIEIASYGKDLPGKPDLADVILAIAEAAPGVRIHLGSLEPTVVTEDFCRKLASVGRICPHFHLSLQSGCDDTLRRMNRKYDTARFYEVCKLLERYFPNCSLTADLIAGFPGESEADFQTTLAFLETCAFSFVHCFPYSIRPGTKAAVMEGQLTKAEKEARVHRANEVVKRLQQQYLERFVGQTLSVLFEHPREGHGDNYCLVKVDADQEKGSVRPVEIIGIEGERLLGRCVEA